MSLKSEWAVGGRRPRRSGGTAGSAWNISGKFAAIAAVTLLFVTALAADGAAETLGFTLENNSGETIVTVNVSPDWKRDWGADQLEGGPIGPGDSRFIAVIQEERYCYFDVMIRSASDESHTYWFIDVCANQTVIHSD